MLDNQKIESIKNYFEDQPVLRAWLFGSQLHENIHAASDVDILVDLDYSKKIGLRFIQMQIDLEAILETKVDLVSSGGISKYILPIIEIERKLIYAK